MPATKPIGLQVRAKDLRLAHGLTLEQLADRIAAHGVEVHPDSLSNVENGRKKASAHLITAWAAALGVRSMDVYQPPVKVAA